MTDRLLTAAEVAELFGFTAGTIVDWAEKGTIPAFKLGGRLRFRESEVLGWLEDRRVGPGPAEEVAPVPNQSPDPGRSLTVAPVPIVGGGSDAS